MNVCVCIFMLRENHLAHGEYVNWSKHFLSEFFVKFCGKVKCLSVISKFMEKVINLEYLNYLLYKFNYFTV